MRQKSERTGNQLRVIFSHQRFQTPDIHLKSVLFMLQKLQFFIVLKLFTARVCIGEVQLSLQLIQLLAVCRQLIGQR